MNGAPLTYAVVAIRRVELEAAAERSRRAVRKPRRQRRLPSLRLRRRKPRFA
jgi:hypothetical protein